MSTTPGLQEDQIRKAVAALLKHVEKQQAKANELLEEEELLYLVIIALKKTPQEARKDKPLRLPLPHSLYDFDGAEVCLIVKDHKGEGHKAAKQRVKEEKLAKVSKVVGVSKLRTKYESAEAKRALCTAYDLFLADERVLPSLPKLLGKTFFKKKKQPIPVDLTGKDWARQVRKATEATYMHHTGGTCINIRVARSSFSAEQCTENIVEAIKGALPHIPKKWNNVQALHVKTATSAALPIYQTLPEQPQRIEIPKQAAQVEA
ncbi:ribosomal protein L1 [Coccomyxa subellipsoidea C-169]|uniref:Ribosomal protein L1 n=1 Tax=Coccomyxa subellipsoidea (strain C-169) TaxID=574566 RepID=I0Z8Y8_COCSC|nr:ribosomal protein L1 [Coccomyxa subellipsoidea C-169]EIE27107.1 ribosomal protein L1 [Coccomyxa subellipsoidea C-169]|eukprot:XP_005651651.1 ribosomal protein L1 [Coccomyxa subellipsoidea C-169]